MVVQDAQAHTTQWLAYTGTDQVSCLLLSNDTSLAYGVLPPRETFGQHASFTVLEPGSAAAGEALALKLAQDAGVDAASCTPFTLRGAAGLDWTAAPWPSSVADPARASSDAVPLLHGSWCGHQRGGLHTCCSGAACAACTLLGATNDACLAACPPQDALDAACAAHALCAHRAGGAVSQGTCASGRQGAALCDCDTALAAAVEETGGCGGKCGKAPSAVAAWVKDRACWRLVVACQHVPCTSGPRSGWCKECAHFKTCDGT